MNYNPVPKRNLEPSSRGAFEEAASLQSDPGFQFGFLVNASSGGLSADPTLPSFTPAEDALDLRMT